MKNRLPTATVLCTAFLLLAGCSMKIVNITPRTLPVNPSGLYTLSMQVDPSGSPINPNSLAASVLIDGEVYPMERSRMGGTLFDYDYRMPPGRAEAEYQYLVNYRMRRLDGEPAKLRERRSPVYSFELTGRYPITLETERAPVGTTVAVLGRGFAVSDRVHVGGEPVQTRFVSANSLEFVVPDTAPGAPYPVDIHGEDGVEPAGSLRIDPAGPLSVTPKHLDLVSGERVALVFALERPAPQGGLFLSATTDVPDSIIMPEVVVPAGARTVNVSVEGGRPGKGTLFVKSTGLSELRIPVLVRSR
jgi:hypothetical protein